MNIKLILNIALFISFTHLNGMNFLATQKTHAAAFYPNEQAKRESIDVKVVDSDKEGTAFWFCRDQQKYNLNKSWFTLVLSFNTQVKPIIEIEGECAQALMDAIATRKPVSVETSRPNKPGSRLYTIIGDAIGQAQNMAHDYFLNQLRLRLVEKNKNLIINVKSSAEPTQDKPDNRLDIPSFLNPFGSIVVENIDGFTIDSSSADSLLKALQCTPDLTHIKITVEPKKRATKADCDIQALLNNQQTKIQLEQYLFMVKMRRIFGVSDALILAALAYFKLSAE